MAFWVHQLVEELIGVLLIAQAMTSTKPAVPVAAGVLLILLGVTADGPIGVARWVPRRVHRVLDVVVIVVLVVGALVLWDDAGAFGGVLVLVAAAAMGVLVWRTGYRRKEKAAPAAEAAEGTSSGERYGRAAGRALGKGITAFRGKDDGSRR